MTLTRADTEFLTVARVGPLMTQATLDGTTVNGTNADLNDPIGWSIQQLGLTVDSLILVDDEDVARVEADDQRQYLDLVELRTMESALNALLLQVDITIGPRSEKLGQATEALKDRIAAKWDQMEQEFGTGLAALSAGRVDFDFAEHVDTE